MVRSPARFCIPIPLIWSCDDDPSPEPTPTPTPGGTATHTPAPTDEGEPSAPAASDQPPTPEAGPEDEEPDEVEDAEPLPDDEAPVFARPPAQMGSGALSFSGLTGIRLVAVPLADGSTTRALKISADRISITGFALTVTPDETEPALVTTADTMTLEGDVEVYLSSLTATTEGGRALTLGADTPPPRDGIEPTLLRVTFGLLGSTADRISYSATDQRTVD